MKDGVERFLAHIMKQPGVRPQHDVVVSTKDMLEASKAKIALLRMEIEKVVRSSVDGGVFVYFGLYSSSYIIVVAFHHFQANFLGYLCSFGGFRKPWCMGFVPKISVVRYTSEGFIVLLVVKNLQ